MNSIYNSNKDKCLKIGKNFHKTVNVERKKKKKIVCKNNNNSPNFPTSHPEAFSKGFREKKEKQKKEQTYSKNFLRMRAKTLSV